MRFVHTSDWHLGRLFHGLHLTEDQAYVLDQLVALLAEVKADALLVAGDLYDRAVPPPDAVHLLDDVLERVTMGLGIPAIAGNHDSPERIGFGSRLLAEQGLHLVGPIPTEPHAVRLADEHGPVYFHPLPYADPADVRVACGAEDAHTHDAALRVLLERSVRPAEAGARHVVLAHAFVTGGESSESERPLSVGGAANVGADAFDGFHYAALGHLHAPQRAGAEHIRYSGSLLKYSFNEADQRKGVLVVDMDASGACQIEEVALQPRHDVRVIEGSLAALLEEHPRGAAADDYLLARLTDTQALYDPMSKLRSVYPNVMQIERLMTPGPATTTGTAAEHFAKSDHDLFAAFFQEVTGRLLQAEQGEAFDRVLHDLEQRRREATT